MRRRQQPDRTWRWIVLVIVFLNIAFNYLSDYLPGKSITEITHQYNSLFTPAEYAFSIWGVINISFIIYAIYQVLPSQRTKILFDHLAKPFVFSNILGMTWIVLYRMNLIMMSTLVLVVMLAASVILYVKVRNVVLRHEYPNWISIPFSLFAGWLSVATIANVAILLVSQGWAGTPMMQLAVSMAFILVAGVLGIFISYRCADFIFPAVITWACVAIFIAHGSDYYSIGAIALLSAALPLIWFLLTIIKRESYRHRAESNKFSFDDTIRLKLNGQNKLLFGRL